MSNTIDITISQTALYSKKLNSLTPTTRWLYVILVGKSASNNSIFRFEYKKLIEITGFSSSTIRRAVIDLEAAGFISYGHGGLQNPNEYKITDYGVIDQPTSNYLQDTNGYIYVILSEKLYKIGRSKYPDKRIEKYHTTSPYPLKLILLANVNNYIMTEKVILGMFETKRIHGEWFNLEKQDVIAIEDYILSCGGLLVDLL